MIRVILSELLLYLNNHWVNRIPFHCIRLVWYRRVMGYALGKGTSVFLGCTMDARGDLSVGNDSIINEDCRLDTRGGLTLGDRVSISSRVQILTADHDVQDRGFRGRNREVVVEDYVFVGTRAMILPGVRIAKGAVIAAGAVVTKDVAAYTIVAGVPARVVGNRSSELDYSPRYRRWFH